MGESPSFQHIASPSLKHYCDRIIGLLDRLAVREAVFVGCSMGGYILFQLCRSYRERILGLIFCNTRCDVDSPQAKENRFKTNEQVKKEGTKSLAESMIPRLFSEKIQPLRSKEMEQVKQWILNSPVDGIVHGNIAMANREDSTSTLSTITVPTLLICGTEDPITGETIMKPLKEGIKAAQWVLIEGTGHLAPLDSPQLVNDALVSFLKNSISWNH